jgi:hypothetical protein
MKTLIVAIALACVVIAFGRPSTAVQVQVTAETISPLAMMMMDTRSLPTESYDAN